MSTGGELFLQPLKEYRDAYDHIIRVCATKNGLNKPERIVEQRERKDVGSDLLDEVDRYVEVLDCLMQYCKELLLVLEVKNREDCY